MKKVMFALCFVLGGMVLVNAQDTTSNQYNKNEQQYPQDQQMQGQQQDRQRIQTSELPDAVKRTLEDQEYRGWLVSGAFTTTANQSSMDSTSSDQNQGNNNAIGTEGQEIYLVELKNGAETKTVAFDKNGERIEGWQDQSNQNGQDSQNGQYNQNDQNGQNNQYNQSDSTQNDQMNQNGQNNQYNQSDSTRSDQMNQSEQSQDSRSYRNSQSPDQSSQSTDQNTKSTDQNSQSTDQNRQTTEQPSQSTTSPDQAGQSSCSGDVQRDQT
jgi:uncharacterized protein YdbL (DUF1318 family)